MQWEGRRKLLPKSNEVCPSLKRFLVAKDLEAALQRVSELAYAPLARHLTNVSHLIVCPDGQLSRVPYEMLLVSGRGEPTRYLVGEKAVSYVGSGREVARLQSRSGFQPDPKVQKAAATSMSDSTKATLIAGSGQAGSLSYVGPPVVMGNPDFDLNLPGSSRRDEAQTNAERGVRNAERKESDRNARPHPGQKDLILSPRLRPQPQEREINPPSYHHCDTFRCRARSIANGDKAATATIALKCS